MQHRLLISVAAFLVLTTCACSRAKEQTKGFPVHTVPDATTHVLCGDGHPFVVTALGSHRFAINGIGVMNEQSLINTLNDQLRYYSQKVLFLRTEPGVSYSDFIEMTDAVYHPDIRIAIMTEHSWVNKYGGCNATTPVTLTAPANWQNTPQSRSQSTTLPRPDYPPSSNHSPPAPAARHHSQTTEP